VVTTGTHLPASPFLLETSSSAFQLTLIAISSTTCPNGTSGVKCASDLIAFNSAIVYTRTFGQSVTTELTADFYYIDVPVNSTSAWNITAISDSADGSVSYKKGPFAFNTAEENNQLGIFSMVITLSFSEPKPFTSLMKIFMKEADSTSLSPTLTQLMEKS